MDLLHSLSSVKHEKHKDKEDDDKFPVERTQPRETDFIRLCAPLQNMLLGIG